MTQKSLIVALVGEPNAGKSSLLNTIVKADIAIVTSKVQTTRENLRGIYTKDDTQMVFIDTPGLFTPQGKLEKFIVKNAKSSFELADIICVIYDPKRINDYVPNLLKSQKVKQKCIAIINKIDTCRKPDLLPMAEKLSDFDCFDEIFFLSAKTHENVDRLLNYLQKQALNSPWLYDQENLTDTPSSVIAEEITRQQAYILLNKEIPYSIKVETEKWAQAEDGVLEVHQALFVLKESQKKIVIGHGGEKLREIGKRARLQIKKVLGRPLRLFIHIKVREDWIERDIPGF